MKAIKLLLMIPVAMIFIAFMAHVVMFMTTSVFLSIIAGWTVGIPIILCVPFVKYISLDFSGTEKYPRPWATMGRATYNSYRTVMPYSPHYISNGRFVT